MFRIPCRTPRWVEINWSSKIQDGGCRQFQFLESVANSVLPDQSSPSWCKCCNFNVERIINLNHIAAVKILSGGGRYLEFPIIVAISIRTPEATKTHQIWWECCDSDVGFANSKSKYSNSVKSQNGFGHHLEFWKTVVVLDQADDTHQILWDSCDSDV